LEIKRGAIKSRVRRARDRLALIFAEGAITEDHRRARRHGHPARHDPNAR
jgi:hypothetical protein